MGFAILPSQIKTYIFYLTGLEENSFEKNVTQLTTNEKVCKQWKIINESDPVWKIHLEAFKKKYLFLWTKEQEAILSQKAQFKSLYIARAKIREQLIARYCNATNQTQLLTLPFREFVRHVDVFGRKGYVTKNLVSVFQMLKLNLISGATASLSLLNFFDNIKGYKKYYFLSYLIHNNHASDLTDRLKAYEPMNRIFILVFGMIYLPFNAEDWIKAGVEDFEDFIYYFILFYLRAPTLSETLYKAKVFSEFPSCMHEDLRKTPITKSEILQMFQETLTLGRFNLTHPVYRYEDRLLTAGEFAECLGAPEAKVAINNAIEAKQSPNKKRRL